MNAIAFFYGIIIVAVVVLGTIADDDIDFKWIKRSVMNIKQFLNCKVFGNHDEVGIKTDMGIVLCCKNCKHTRYPWTTYKKSERTEIVQELLNKYIKNKK